MRPRRQRLKQWIRNALMRLKCEYYVTNISIRTEIDEELHRFCEKQIHTNFF